MFRATLKDVDGVYESDPASAVGCRPRRFASLGYAETLELAGPLIQPKAVHFLDRQERTAEVASLASPYESHVGCNTTTLSDAIATAPTRVLLLGLGTVGGAVYRRLASMPDHFRVVGAYVRSGFRRSRERISEPLLQTDAALVHQIDCDVVVDALPGLEPSSGLPSEFRKRGIDVVSANKTVIAKSGPALGALAARHATGVRNVGKFAATDRIVCRVVHVGGVCGQLESARLRNHTVVQGGLIARDVHLAVALGFLERLLGPGARVEIIDDGIGARKIQRNG